MREVFELVISWLVISFCFSVYGVRYGMDFFATIFLASLLTAGLGFVLHELMHRFTARRFGCLAEYRMWLWGLILALIVALASEGRIIFAAPGAVYITPLALSSYIPARQVERAYGLISLSGPMANIILAALFYMLLNIRIDWFFYMATRIGFTVNLWLAAFNLIPIPPLDGFKVFRWSPLIWGAVAIPVWVIMMLAYF